MGIGVRRVDSALLMFALTSDLPACAREIASRLRLRPLRRLEIEHSGRAAVLMPILQQTEGLAFVLTQRTHKVETHKGQISFPGGVQDPVDENLLQTALRETREEIGLQSDRVFVLGEFDEYLSITGLVVTPFLGWISEPLELRPNPDEVEEILKVPFSTFRDHRLLRVERQTRAGLERDVYFYNYEGREVWGLTARIIRDFLQILAQSGI
jgi:8-oxo-dGTP pyrophosphatase MutT (NUDIX family)